MTAKRSKPSSRAMVWPRRDLRPLLALLVVALVAFGLVAVFHSRAGTAGTLSFANSGLDGSGFQNVVSWSPFKDSSGRRPVLLGADIAGVHRSYDGGKNWLPQNVGLPSHQIAALMWSDVTPGKVYAATNGGIAVSTDWGGHWTKRAAPVDFDANGNYQIGGQEHPRPTGQLLEQDNSGSTHYLYAATATQGVKRSSDDGASWEAVALGGLHLRTLARDPANHNTLYVGTVENGLEVTTAATGGFGFTQVAGDPAGIPEEMRFVAGKLYIAHGTAGIYSYAGGNWTALNSGVPISGSKWESITGFKDAAGNIVLYAGCADPQNAKHTLKSTNGGATWTAVSTGTGVTVSSKEYGQTFDWWAATNSYLSFSGNAFVTADIGVNPDNPAHLIIAGRGGAKAGEETSTGVNWWPSVHGLMVTVNNMVVADPKLPGRVYDASMDYTFLASTDDAATILGHVSPSGAPSTGDYIALDPDGPSGHASTVYLAASVRGQNTGTGYIYSNPDPVANPSGWNDEKIPVSNDVLAMGVGHSSLSGNRIILASITGNGLYRKDGANWAKISGTAPFATGGYGTFTWRPGTNTVYCMDGSGTWRSDSAGISGTWVKLAGGSAGYDNINAIALDPTTPSVIYASDNTLGGVVRINGANTASPTVTKILAVTNPGPIAVTPGGTLYAHDRSGARLMVSTNPTAATPSFVNLADSFYADNNSGIRSLAAGPDGYVYTASNSAGLTVGTTATVTPSPTTPPPTIAGDLNGDGKVDVFDLSIMLSKWGTNDATADLNHDGTVNVFDLSLLLSHWG